MKVSHWPEPLQYPWPRPHSMSGCVRHGREIESAMISDSLLSRSFVSRSDEPKCWKDTNLKGTKANLNAGNGCSKSGRMDVTQIAFRTSRSLHILQNFSQSDLSFRSHPQYSRRTHSTIKVVMILYPEVGLVLRAGLFVSTNMSSYPACSLML